jgi:protoporphyrinogen/coproporphyrinogen III oxidase
MKKIVILGGGITGLTLLWYLKREHGPQASLLLLEKSSRVGGWIQTIKKEGFLFERGPRSCRARGNGLATLRLVEELGLQDQVIGADSSAHQRFLYCQQRLQKIPSGFLSFLFSPLAMKILPSLLMEWTVKPTGFEDESIYDFFSRRLGNEAVDTFLDPLISGIYAGNIHELSAKACFPQLFQWERHYGSLTKGLLLNLFSRKKESVSDFIKGVYKNGLFSFREGMEVLPQTLYKRLESHILLNREVIGLENQPQGLILKLSNGESIQADQVYSALPASALSSMIRASQPQTAKLLDSMTAASVGVVSLGYKEKLLSQPGFGYLVPSKEKENILGVVWDSCVFPQQSASIEDTRLTVMIGGTNSFDTQWEETDFLNCALESLAKHLKIKMEPHTIDVHIARSAITQYAVGHDQKKAAIQNALGRAYPSLHILGSSFDGVAVNDCIAIHDTIH